MFNERLRSFISLLLLVCNKKGEITLPLPLSERLLFYNIRVGKKAAQSVLSASRALEKDKPFVATR